MGTFGYGSIFRFWFPLAVTWLLMACEGPWLTALVARLPAAVANLAAYGVAYAFALLAESPVIMLMSAAIALCHDPGSYRKVREFTLWLSLLVTGLLVLLVIPPVFEPLARDLLKLPEEVANSTRIALWCLLPWPGAIGLRRFYQGVLILEGQTRRVMFGTAIRVIGMGLAGWLAMQAGFLPGAAIGGLALSAGVVLEMLAVRWFAGPAIAALLQREEAVPPPGLREIWRYYLPLAMTPFIALSIQPVLTFFLGLGIAPLESLAVMPVLFALTFLFRALGLSYQEAAVALLGRSVENRRKLERFALWLGCFCVAVLALIALTPLADLWLRKIAGLSPELVAFSRLPLILMTVLPGLTVWLTWQRSLLLALRRTGPISTSTLIEALVIFLLLGFLVPAGPWPGILPGALALVIGRLLGIIYLRRHCRVAIRSLQGEV